MIILPRTIQTMSKSHPRIMEVCSICYSRSHMYIICNDVTVFFWSGTKRVWQFLNLLFDKELKCCGIVWQHFCNVTYNYIISDLLHSIYTPWRVSSHWFRCMSQTLKKELLITALFRLSQSKIHMILTVRNSLLVSSWNNMKWRRTFKSHGI